MPDELMPAGRFGSLTLLSAKALRLYAERDLLPPHHVDRPTASTRHYVAHTRFKAAGRLA